MPLQPEESPEKVDVSVNGGWKVFVVVLTWVLVGASVYWYLNEWTFAASVYYTVNAGFSIGFGALSEDSELSMIWSVVMIATGATAAAAALGYYVESWFQHLDKLDENATSASMTLIGVMRGDQIEDVDGDGKADCWDVLDKLWHESCGKHLTFTRKALLGMAVWVGVGVVFGMVDQGWGFVRSLYFSVAAMSTAGLQAPNIRGDGNGNGDDFSAYFVALFCLLGVPLFGVAMGLIANVFVDSLVQARVSLQQDLSDEEFNRVAGLSIDDGTVQFGEFFILELLRQGKVDMDGVHAIKRAYDQIDANGDGTLSAHEVRRFHKICALRHRYAQFLASQKKMQHDFAIAVVIEMDTRALVQKSIELGWLAPAADVVLDVGSAEAV